MSVYAEVVFALPVDQSYTYSVPEGLVPRLEVGVRVLAPLGRRCLTGFVTRIRLRRPSGGFELKPLQEILDEAPVFSPGFLKFTRRLADWYFASWGDVLQAALPPSLIVRSVTRFKLREGPAAEAEREPLTRDESSLAGLLGQKAYTARHLQRQLPQLDVSSLLNRLEKRGLVARVKETTRTRRRQPEPAARPVSQLELDFSLDLEALQAARGMGRSLEEGGSRALYLHTGSERRKAIYLYLLKRNSGLQRTALVLVPEIAQSEGLRLDLESKLGESVSVLHSRMTPAQRAAQWQRIRSGRVHVVIGPRSALFAPLDNLGLVIVEEEQDPSYVQKEAPAFDARRGALLRAREAGALLVYGSAWPAVETLHRARRNGNVVHLPGSSQMGYVEILDDSRSAGLIHDRIVERVGKRLKSEQEPVLVFCSRRGYASYLRCSRCSYISRCPRCDVTMPFHKRDDRLLCHTCGHAQAVSSTCPECGGRMKAGRNPGIEVIAEEFQRRFPSARVVSFDRDSASQGADREGILTDFAAGRIDILLGTPFLAHSLNLPHAGLVAVLHPEAALSAPDFQAGQRAAHNLRQVIRYLAAARDSELLIQTEFPWHHCIRPVAYGRFEDFYEKEIQYRRTLGYPPFSYMAEIVFQGENMRSLAKRTRDFAGRVDETAAGVEILGPALAPVSRIRGRNRVQMFVKSSRKSRLDRALRGPLSRVSGRRSVQVFS
jgi:primosomal protein N' (replication factor Y)